MNPRYHLETKSESQLFISYRWCFMLLSFMTFFDELQRSKYINIVFLCVKNKINCKEPLSNATIHAMRKNWHQFWVQKEKKPWFLKLLMCYFIRTKLEFLVHFSKQHLQKIFSKWSDTATIWEYFLINFCIDMNLVKSDLKFIVSELDDLKCLMKICK